MNDGVPNTKPNTGDTVICHYISKKLDNSILDNTYKRKMPYSFTFGTNRTTEGFERAISTMNTEETSHFKVPWQFLYGKQGLPGNLPQETNLSFEIKVIKIIKQSDIQEMVNNHVTNETKEPGKEEPDPNTTLILFSLQVYTKAVIALTKHLSGESSSQLQNIDDPTDTINNFIQNMGIQTSVPNTAEKTEQEEQNKEQSEEDIIEDEDGKTVSADEVTEGVEATEEEQVPSAKQSNIKQMLKLMVTAFWPSSTEGHFLDKMQPKNKIL